MTPNAIQKLLALDAEMEADRRGKLLRTIHMRRGKHRIPVFVSRSVSGYYASARLNNSGHSAWGKVPSHAVAHVCDQLIWTLDRMAVQENFPNGESARLAELKQEGGMKNGKTSRS